MRTAIKHLEAQVDFVNKITNSPAETWSRGSDNKLRANIGNYYISQAYGAFTLFRIMNEGGGVQTPLGGGRLTKKDLSYMMGAFIAGFQAASK